MPDRVVDPEIAELASRLRAVVAPLVRRYRREGSLPVPQLTALGWIDREGTMTASRLAVLEHVRPQSMAHTVTELESAGLVERRPDPEDGRQTLIDLTAAGATAMAALRHAGDSWVAGKLAADYTAAERAELARGVELLGRLVSE